MIRIDERYTDFRDDTDPNYPGGKAVNAPTPESVEGTPFLAEWMNCTNGFRQALMRRVFGTLDGISGKPDNANESDTLDAIEKLIGEYLDNMALQFISMDTIRDIIDTHHGIERTREILRIAHKRLADHGHVATFANLNEGIRGRLNIPGIARSDQFLQIIPNNNFTTGRIYAFSHHGRVVALQYDITAERPTTSRATFLFRTEAITMLADSFGLTMGRPLPHVEPFTEGTRLVNKRGDMINVLHFPGKGRSIFSDILQPMSYLIDDLRLPDDITVVTFTDSKRREARSPLTRQLTRSGVPFVNAGLFFDRRRDGEWRNWFKIKFLPDVLSDVGTRYVLILDADDVAVQTFDGMLENFRVYGVPVLFGASKARYPDLAIDTVRDRDSMGEYRYLNAGTCIGETDRILDFYTRCRDLYDEGEAIALNSEQHIVREAFNDCQDWVAFDYRSIVFQTFGVSKNGMTKVELDEDSNVMRIT